LHVSGENLIIGTNTKGLWVYDIVSTKKIELKEGINPDQILLLTPSLGEAFWVLSDGAVQKLYLDNDLLIQIQAIDLRAQIKSTEVTHMTEHENELYILSKDGINTFPAGSSKTLKELKVMPLRIKIDNQLIPISKTIALNVDQSLRFKFASVNFSRHATKLSYRVNNGDWKEMEEGNVFLNFNESGKYQLEVKGSSNFYKNSAPLLFTISVEGDILWGVLIGFILTICITIFVTLKLRKNPVK
jgi:ligand-binding sensor domain-containing protein